ncbi:unnamed protein product [Closterium sp. NIES-64]|nr:unnamed protein product [Closterium sp. NIES-64]CAI5990069.1 unnamed protein product [Closterium sp. NIES-64]
MAFAILPRRISTTTMVLFVVVVSNIFICFVLLDEAPSVPLLSRAGKGGGGGLGSGGRGRERGGSGGEGRRHPRVAAHKLTPAEIEMLEMRKQNFDGSSSKEGFIQFSAYRITPLRVVAMGLMPLTHHDVITAQHCWWESANGQWTDGAISVKFPGEHHARAYECVLLYCDLQRPVSSMVGGTLKMAVDQQDLVVYKESPGTPEPPPEVREDVRVFERNLTYCSAPMFGVIDTQRLLEWIEFHRTVHGVDVSKHKRTW